MSGLPEPRLASISTAGYEDGLGRRSVRFDREVGGMLECLHLRPELGAFEASLHERANALALLDDERFARVRTIARDPHGLVVVSELVPGQRLIDVIDTRQRDGGAGFGIDAAFGFLLQALPAISRLHAGSIVHGALSPGRIILTPGSQLVLLDGIYAEALDRLKLSRGALWSSLWLMTAPSAGAARFDRHADVTQAVMCALVLALGRPIEGSGDPAALVPLVQEATELAEIRAGRAFADGVQQLLGAALPLLGRRPMLGSDEASTEVQQLALSIGAEACHAALADLVRFEPPIRTPASVQSPMPVAAPVKTGDRGGERALRLVGTAPTKTDRRERRVVPRTTPKPVRPREAATVLPASPAPPPAAPAVEPEHPLEIQVATPAVVPAVQAPTAAPPAVSLTAAAESPSVCPGPGSAAAGTERSPLPVPVVELKLAAPVSAPPVVPAPSPVPAVSLAPPPPPAPPTPLGVTSIRSPAPVSFSPLPPIGFAPPPPPVPVSIAPVAPAVPPIAAAPMPTLRVRAEPPSGYAPVRSEGEGLPRALPFVDRTPPARLPAFPWKLVVAAIVVLVLGIVAARSLLQRSPEASAPAPTAAASAPAPAAVAEKRGRLVIESQPSGAKVTMDGAEVGTTPLKLDGVEPGRHTLVVATDTASVRRNVRIEAGKLLTVDVPVYSGWVSVFAPISLEVAAGGRSLGSTETGKIMLPPGRHTLTLSNRDYGFSETRTVEIHPGEERPLNVEPMGRVNINAHPWAEVWVDGKRAGETPIANLQVLLGTRVFTFKHPLYGERRVTSTITSTAAALSVDFTKP